jgi:tetratricopeptide (TPR) repeat protein
VLISIVERLRQAAISEAERLTGEARARFSARPAFALAYANMAQSRRDWPAALRRWEYVRQRFPDMLAGYLGVAAALRELKRPADIERLFGTIRERFPARPAPAAVYAQLAQSRRDWPVALQRWDYLRERFPQLPQAYLGAALALREMRRFGEAEAVFDSARDRFPQHAGVAVAWARLADRRADKPEALRRWEDVHNRFPDVVHGSWGAARVLREIGRVDEADRLFVATRKRFPQYRGVALEYVMIAAQRRDASETMRRCEEVRKEFPDFPSPHLFSGFVTSLAQLDDVDRLAGVKTNEDQRSPDHQIPSVGSAFLSAAAKLASLPQNGSDDRCLMMNFESMGNNCELGLVQRQLGAEPLGLLRWSSTPAKLLAAAIEAKFEGFGLPENTKLQTSNNQYFLFDTRYRTMTHTFIFVGDVAPERLFLTMTRRMQYLSNKFIEDLTNSEKIFVYRQRNLPLEVARTLHRAMRNYGDCTLLCVDQAEAGATAGTVKVLENGLLFGYLDRLWDRIGEMPSFDCWVTLCRQAYDLWNGPGSMSVQDRTSSAGPSDEGRLP